MFKKLFSGILIMALAASLSGCGTLRSIISEVGQGLEESANSASNSVGGSFGGSSGGALEDPANGDIVGNIGTTYSTQWFDFAVKSYAIVDSYAGYTADRDNVLVDLVLYEKCTFDYSITVGTFDFWLDVTSAANEYNAVDAVVALDETMMPDEMELSPGESIEYHLVFEVPADSAEVSFIYLEIDEDDDAGLCFIIPLDITTGVNASNI